MKWLMFILFLVLMPLIISGYSIIFNVVISGNSIAILGYKLLWIFSGNILFLLWKRTFGKQR
jgi:hypothetical protein